MTTPRSTPLITPARKRTHRRRSAVKPPKPTGYPWWAYATLVIVAVIAVGLTYTALTTEHEPAHAVVSTG